MVSCRCGVLNVLSGEVARDDARRHLEETRTRPGHDQRTIDPDRTNMPFLDPKGRDDEDDALPGAPGLHLDLAAKLCPSCRRQALPWQQRCPECGSELVSPTSMPAETFHLPAHLLDDEDGDEDGDGTEEDGGDSGATGDAGDAGDAGNR